MYFHAVISGVERYVGHVEKIVREVLLDHVSFVSTADDEIANPIMGIDFHDVPENRLPAYFDHRFRLEVRLFRDSSPESSGEYDGLHKRCHSCRRFTEEALSCASLHGEY